MRRMASRPILARLFFVFAVTGCGGEEGAKPNPVSSPAGQWESRLDAAKAITNGTERDEELSVLVIDAGKQGEGAIVKKGVEAIGNGSSKDTTASLAAVELAKSGKGQDASDVAKMITDGQRRDQTLSKIAKGP